MAILLQAQVTDQIIGAAIEVHRGVGPGLLESAYREFLVDQLDFAGLRVEREKPVAVTFHSRTIECAYRADLIVNDSVLVELKAVEKLLPVHQAQALTYMRLARLRVGLLINFNAPKLIEGLRRLVL